MLQQIKKCNVNRDRDLKTNKGVAMKKPILLLVFFYASTSIFIGTQNIYAGIVPLTSKREAGAYKVAFEKKQHDNELLSALLRLESDDDKLKAEAISSLIVLQDPRAILPLITILRNSQGNIRVKAAFALGELRSNQAVASLIASLNDYDWMLQKEAAFALGKIKNRRAAKPLIKALDSRDYDLRRESAWALGEIKDLTSISPLINHLADKDIQQECALALSKIGKPAINDLIQALKDNNEDIRMWASAVLGKINDIRSFKPLFKALNDESLKVRKRAEHSLSRIKHTTAIEYLIANLDNQQTRKEVCSILIIIGEPAVDQLINALAVNDNVTNEYIIEILAAIGDDAVFKLSQGLYSSNPIVRALCAKALGNIKDTRAVTHLIKALTDKDKKVRTRSAEALGEIKDQRAIEPLKKALDDTFWATRYKATFALSKIENPVTIRYLITALKDSDIRVQDEASWGLSVRTGNKLGRDYNAWQKWADNKFYR